MGDELAPPDARLARLKDDSLDAELRALAEGAAELVRSKKAPRTLRAYTMQFERFRVWCEARGFPSMPTQVEAVVGYITWMEAEGLTRATLAQAIAAIAYEHRERQQPWDSRAQLLRDAVEGFRRRRSARPTRKAPVMPKDLRAMVEACGDDLLGVRDKAILLLGWWGALRREEIVSLDVGDVSFVDEGLLVLLRQSKTDKYAEGQEIGIWKQDDQRVCADAALRAWLKAASVDAGPIFRAIGRGAPRFGAQRGELLGERLSPAAVAGIVKRRASAVGIDADSVSGHSLRAGFVTTAAERGRSVDEIMRQTRHADGSERIVRGYIRHATVFKKNATKNLLSDE